MESCNYKFNDSKMYADVSDGIAIIINSVTGIYYGMNGFGTCIYENLLAGSSNSDIVSAVKAIPGAPEDFEASCEEFIGTLVAFEIVVPSGEASSRVPEMDPAIASADDFKMVCSEYSDVQELLFADPIHEVDIEEGWKP